MKFSVSFPPSRCSREHMGSWRPVRTELSPLPGVLVQVLTISAGGSSVPGAPSFPQLPRAIVKSQVNRNR